MTTKRSGLHITIAPETRRILDNLEGISFSEYVDKSVAYYRKRERDELLLSDEHAMTIKTIAKKYNTTPRQVIDKMLTIIEEREKGIKEVVLKEVVQRVLVDYYGVDLKRM